MDKKALYNLTYGVFMLSTKVGDITNGCITNTCMQVANSPTRIAISVLNTNYTCELIKQSKVFALTWDIGHSHAVKNIDEPFLMNYENRND